MERIAAAAATKQDAEEETSKAIAAARTAWEAEHEAERQAAKKLGEEHTASELAHAEAQQWRTFESSKATEIARVTTALEDE